MPSSNNMKSNVESSFAQFILGFLAPARGLRLIFLHRDLLRLALLPLLISIVVMLSGLVFFLPGITSLVTNLAAQSAIWLGLAEATFLGQAVYWLVVVLLWPVSAVLLFYLLWIVTRVLTSPFFSLLAERSLILLQVIPHKRFVFSQWLEVSLRMLRVSLVRGLALLVIGVFLAILSLIPGLEPVTALAFLFLLAADLADYSLEALGAGLRSRIEFVRQHWLCFLGLACSVGVIFLLPLLNMFLLPVIVVGASDLVSRLPRIK